MKKIKLDASKLHLTKQKIAMLQKDEMKSIVGGAIAAVTSPTDQYCATSVGCLTGTCPPPASDRLCGGGCTSVSGW